MHAWAKSGEPIKHPEPWGIAGAFSTLRLLPNGYIPFREAYCKRLLDSAHILQLSWIPEESLIDARLNEFLRETETKDGLIRICLFENSIGFSARSAESDGKKVEGWLLQYRRPIPNAKSTQEKELYGRLSELDLSAEDWIIIDPKDKDIRESATANLIFVKEDQLVIPDKRILKGVVLRKMLPQLSDLYSVIHASPSDQEINEFDEILLCGTGRGIAPLESLPELGWSSTSESAFKKIRSEYEQIISKPNG